jgi:hypothetical protein
MASSHAFFILSVSSSSLEGPWRTSFLDDCARCFALSGAVKPGGSGKVALDRGGGVELRSRAHCGGGGAVEVIALSFTRNLFRGLSKMGDIRVKLS